jgi:superfamily II DNA or RNA helicase
MSDWYRLPVEGKGGILALPTGGGKTFTAVHFLCSNALSDGYKVLWLAHTHHLLEQAFGAFDAGVLRHVREPRETLSLRVVSGTPGHYAPKEIETTDDVVIGTLQTITHAHHEKLPFLRKFLLAAKGKLLVVFDEAHHAPAPSYRKLLEALRSEFRATLLGLTATPTYSNEAKKGWLAKLFPQGIIAQARAQELMAAGVLAIPHFEPHRTSVKPDFNERDYQKWLGSFRDVPEQVIEQLARNAERNELIAATYVEQRKKYGKTIMFTDRWFQCEAIVAALKKRGVKAGAVYSHVDRTLSHEKRQKRDRDENAKVLARFRAGEIDVLVNVKMLTEGTDLPDAQTVFITRQTTSQILMTQMIGRALRGPKFGGTTDAYIVLFMDDWQHAIRFADYESLEGRADESPTRTPKRAPIELISIDLVKRLARQMDSGVNRTSVPFISLMPAGWFHVVFDSRAEGSEDVEQQDQLVLVFDDERKGFDAAIADLAKSSTEIFSDEAVEFENCREALEPLYAKHLGSATREKADLLFDLFQVARHIGQGQPGPDFFSYDARKDHDLDEVARDFTSRDLRRSEETALIEAEYARKDRFWRTLFPRYDQFRSFYEACAQRDSTPGGKAAAPIALPPPATREPTEEEKAQVIRRDGGKCLACGATKYLQVDHAVPVWRGGSNELDNLQTLCKVCNTRKGTRTMRFTTQLTTLGKAPGALEHFDDPDDAGDRDHWERFLRRTINFTFQCGAVSEIGIAGRGKGYYNWSVELVRGNSPKWLKAHMKGLLRRVQEARVNAGKPEIASITILAPGEDKVVCTQGG